MVEGECHKVNPIATKVRIAGETLARKDKIQCDGNAEENDKGWENAESPLQVEPTDVLADRQGFHL